MRRHLPPSPTCCRPCANLQDSQHWRRTSRFGGLQIWNRPVNTRKQSVIEVLMLQYRTLRNANSTSVACSGCGSQNCCHQSYPLNPPLLGPFQCSGLIEVSSCWDGVQWNHCLRTYCNKNFRGWIAGFNPFCQLIGIRTLGHPGILAAGSCSPLMGINIPNIDY